MSKQAGWWSIPGSGFTVMRVAFPYQDFMFCMSLGGYKPSRGSDTHPSIKVRKG